MTEEQWVENIKDYLSSITSKLTAPTITNIIAVNTFIQRQNRHIIKKGLVE